MYITHALGSHVQLPFHTTWSCFVCEGVHHVYKQYIFMHSILGMVTKKQDLLCSMGLTLK